MKNVEIKAKVDNIDELEKKAKEMSTAPLQVIKQHDIFFNIPIPDTTVPDAKVKEGGRLKLRQFEDKSGELIYYLRSDKKGPKISTYSKAELNPEKCKEIKTVLSAANGVLGEVKKTRHLYLIGQTRVHIDRVEGLGNFMELEVVLGEKDDEKIGYEIIDKLKKTFGIKEENLLKGAYLDLLKKDKN